MQKEFTKDVLEEVIFKINRSRSFLIKGEAQSVSTSGFSYDRSIDTAYIDTLVRKGYISESGNNVICFLNDRNTNAEGIIFTSQAMYVNSSRNKVTRFHVRYADIEQLQYYAATPSLTIRAKGRFYFLNTPLWSKKNINIFLQFATGNADFDQTDWERIKDIRITCDRNCDIRAAIAGLTYGNVSNASTLYGMDKFNTPRGHGFAAERANHLYDKVHNMDFFGQEKVRLVGEQIDPATGHIVKDGADRIVNGTNIQTKYCRSGSACIAECFRDNKFRYFNLDGTPMQIEVPSDMYDSAVQAMENRISRGEVPGVTDPAEAKNIVKEGHYTYQQAKNIAKAGTIDSIKFDAATGAVIASSALGISAAIAFATSIWNGEEIDTALKNATYTGLKVGGTTFVTAILSSQLSRAGLNSALVGSSEAIVNVMGPKASAMLVNAFRSGSNIYGAAAMKSAAKMLRGNVITGAISVAVLSSVDVMNIFRGRISGKQLFKNVAGTASTVAGGTAGWAAGATAGAVIGSVIPIIGTTAGGIVGAVLGSIGGGAVGGKLSGEILDEFIEDDADEMVGIIEGEFTQLAKDYLLNQKEATNIVEHLQQKLDDSLLKDMYQSSDRSAFARKLMIDDVQAEIAKRQKIHSPSIKQMQRALKEVLEDIADQER